MKNKIIAKFTLFKFLEGLAISFAFSTGQLFFQKQGLSLLQINLLNLIYMSSIFILEIPTGALADLFGRKKLVALGLLLKSLAFLICYYSNNFFLFASTQVLAAMGFSCISGALEGLIVNLVKAKDNYSLSLKELKPVSWE